VIRKGSLRVFLNNLHSSSLILLRALSTQLSLKVSHLCYLPWVETKPDNSTKVQPISEESDLRPISLIVHLSNVLEDFVENWIISDRSHKIDPQQFGCLKSNSTTYCKPTWHDAQFTNIKYLDDHRKYLRVCFLHFSKAFDRIDHTILITKLINFGVSRSLIPWICGFLSDCT
jgi:hypothetical protein